MRAVARLGNLMSLSSKDIDGVTAAALEAIAGAADLDSLKEVRIAHVGDKSPIARANQSLASLDPSARAEFGKVIGKAKIGRAHV